MKLSVIVPVYNVEMYLEKCLDSLVNQTLKGIEIIIVNDGSKDGSQKIIDSYSEKYPQIIRTYKKDNGGLSSARNYGIKKANGEYIAFVDSDDYVDLNMFSIMYNYALEKKLDIVVCDTINVYDSGEERYIKSYLKYSDDDVKNYIISPPMACTRIYKKTIFDNCMFKEGIFYEDLNLTPSLVNISKKIGFIDKGLYYYYQRSGSIMKQINFNEKLLDIFAVLNNNYQALFDEYPAEVEYLYITHLLRTASLRFLNYNNSKIYLKRINSLIKEKFPAWKKNVYYKKSSLKLKVICNLAFKGHYRLLKQLTKLYN